MLLIKIVFFIFLFPFFSLASVAAEIENSKEKSIPFIIYETSFSGPLLQYSAAPSVQSKSPAQLVYVGGPRVSKVIFPSLDEIKNFIKNVKKVLCESAGDADVKIWVAADVDGKIVGVGAAAQSGIEITLHCNN